MTETRTLYIGEHPPEAWRRFVYAACHDCDWQYARRDYRSKHAENLRTIAAAAARHAVETSGHQTATYFAHG